MKRNVVRKPNQGSSNPRNRVEKKADAEKFIEDCVSSLIRMLDQESKKPATTWPDLYNLLEYKTNQLLANKLYQNRRGHILIASTQVRKALDKVVSERREVSGYGNH